PPPPRPPTLPYPTLFRPERPHRAEHVVGIGPHLEVVAHPEPAHDAVAVEHDRRGPRHVFALLPAARVHQPVAPGHGEIGIRDEADRKSTRLNSSHQITSY